MATGTNYVPDVKFAETLGQLIEQGGFKRNRKKICSATGITSAALSQYLTKKTRPSFHVLIKLASFFGVTLDYLVFGRDVGSHAAVDYGPLARYMDMSLAAIQAHTAEQSALVARIGRVLAESIGDAASRVAEAGSSWGAGMLPDNDTLVVEAFSEETWLASMDLGYDVIEMPDADEAAAGRFLSVVASNLARGRSYRILLPGSMRDDWAKLVELYRKMLRRLVGADVLVDRCHFRVAKSPLFVGVGLYKLDTAEFRSQYPMLHAQLEGHISSDGWFGYAIPPSKSLLADAIFDSDHLRNARRGFDLLWKNAKAP